MKKGDIIIEISLLNKVHEYTHTYTNNVYMHTYIYVIYTYLYTVNVCMKLGT